MEETPQDLPLTYWGTQYAGQIVGAASGDPGNPMLPGTQLSLNSTNDLSQIIVANNGGFVQQINYLERSGLRQGQIAVLGQGPSGTGSGSLDLYFLTQGGFVHTLSLTSSSNDWRYDDFEDTSGIIAIWWLQSESE
jgi:hypothetical protein